MLSDGGVDRHLVPIGQYRGISNLDVEEFIPDTPIDSSQFKPNLVFSRRSHIPLASVGRTRVEQVSVDGEHNLSAVQRKLAQQRRSILKCYQKELKKDRTIKGKMTLLLTIKRSGRVGAIEVVTNTTNDPSLARCIVRLHKKVRFPTLESGPVQLKFTIPFGV